VVVEQMLNLKCNILHLEDDDNDSLFFQRALKRRDFIGAYRRVSTVEAAIHYLDGIEEFAERRLFPLPDVLVMDSSLSGKQTTEDLLKWLEGRKEFRPLIRVMLTGGVNPAAEESWRKRGVTAVLAKGVTLSDFAASVEEVLRRCMV
jgi:CheY-like chemotaxis protein